MTYKEAESLRPGDLIGWYFTSSGPPAPLLVLSEPRPSEGPAEQVRKLWSVRVRPLLERPFLPNKIWCNRERTMGANDLTAYELLARCDR